jgi:hypothetical protein
MGQWARCRRGLTALVSGLTLGGALVAVAAPAVALPTKPAPAPLEVSLAGYVPTAALHGTHVAEGPVATGQAPTSSFEALDATQSRDVDAVRKAASGVLAATRDAVAARARFSGDLATCEERPSAKACYEEEGRREVLRTSVDLDQMSGAGSSWLAAELGYESAAQALKRALGPLEPALSARPREAASKYAVPVSALQDELAAFHQAVKATAGYRAAGARLHEDEATCSKAPSTKQCGLCWDGGTLYWHDDRDISRAASLVAQAGRSYFDAEQALGEALGVRGPSPAAAKSSGFSLWDAVLAVGVCAATAPLDETGVGEGMDAAFIASEVASADSEEVAPSAEVATDAAEGTGPAASSMTSATGLARQLAGKEASSIFTDSGDLQPSVIRASGEIIEGPDLKNPEVVKALTADGSNIADWGKYSTPTFESPSGPFQVHFYYNETENTVDYSMDYKAVLNRGIQRW